MARIIINPGTGPVTDASEALAQEAANQMRVDLASINPRHADELRIASGVTIERKSSLDEGGRYGFSFALNERSVDVEIPGIAIDRVRYLGDDGQNIWHFPRLYVDGSSWVWMYALTSIRQALAGTQEDES